MAYTYIIKCKNGSLYTGMCKCIEKRICEHYYKTEAAAKYTRAFGIASIEALWESDDLSKAGVLEYAVKQLSRKQKEELIENPEMLGTKLLKNIDAKDYLYIKGITLEKCIEKK